MTACKECKHHHFVFAHPWGSSMSGPGCKLTGGHAIKACASFDNGTDTCDNCGNEADLYEWNDSLVCDDCAQCMLDDENVGDHKHE